MKWHKQGDGILLHCSTSHFVVAGHICTRVFVYVENRTLCVEWQFIYMPLVCGHNVSTKHLETGSKTSASVKWAQSLWMCASERAGEKRHFTRHLASSFTFLGRNHFQNNRLTTTHLLKCVAILKANDTSIQTYDRDEDACYSIRTVNRVCD